MKLSLIILVTLLVTGCATVPSRSNISVTAVDQRGKYVHALCTLASGSDESQVWSGNFTSIELSKNLSITCRHPYYKDGSVSLPNFPRDVVVPMGSVL